MPDEYVSFSTAPLPVLSTKGVNGERGESSDTTFYMSLRSQDVFRHSTKIVYPETEIGMTKAFLKAVSFCTSSWRTPSVCELDAPATSTRFLFYLHIKYTEHDYIVSELLLSPTSTFPPSKSSVSSVNAETPENEFILTHQRQCHAYSYKRRHMFNMHVSRASRSGHVIATYHSLSRESTFGIPHIDNKKRGAYAINLHESLEERLPYESIESSQEGRSVRRVKHPSLIGGVLGTAVDAGHDLSIEKYSSAIWYLSGSTLFIHHTD